MLTPTELSASAPPDRPATRSTGASSTPASPRTRAAPMQSARSTGPEMPYARARWAIKAILTSLVLSPPKVGKNTKPNKNYGIEINSKFCPQMQLKTPSSSLTPASPQTRVASTQTAHSTGPETPSARVPWDIKAILTSLV